MNYLLIENLTKSYGEKLLFEDITFGIDRGQKVALIARNGAGKSSLLNIINQKDLPDSGKVVFRKDIHIAYLPQNPELDENQTIVDVLFNTDNKYLMAIRQYEEALDEIKKQDDFNNRKLLEDAIHQVDILNCWDYENKVKEILSRLQITDIHQTVNTLSGGQRKKVALSKVLIEEADLLILDEPTNHLDISMIEWLEEYLSKQSLSILLVTHDRYFLDNVCTEVLELDNGKIFHYKGKYNYFLEKKADRELIERQEIEKAKNTYRKELDWMRRMPKARTTKSQARIDSFYNIQEKASKRIDDKKVELSIKTERVGGKILEMYNVSKAFGDKKVLHDFTYTFKKGERIGVVGKNGIGKTTFLNMIVDKQIQDSGRIVKGQTISFGYYSQEGLQTYDDKRVIEIVREIAEVVRLDGGKELSASVFLNYFGFSNTLQYNYYSNLSGGEKRRLFLLMVLMQNPNFLILDEPTNDLDIFTLMMLEEFLLQYKGCLLLVSHDRSFMDNLVDHIFVFEDNGIVKDYHSTYTEYTRKKLLKEKQLKSETKKDEKPVERIKQTSNKPTFKQKQEYELLEKEINELEREKENILKLLNGGSDDVVILTKWSERIAEIIALTDEKTLRWIELSEIIE
ncbi:MAG: ABC-F family ATP-binding cassette domain-containing protein [Bacteroidetes bacterium]|nr:ABC-F family ATP-binding cassette domain-containing protein [Bacteroidota bacterium]